MEPLLPATWYDDCIALGDFQVDSALHVRQLDQFWHTARPLAYGAAGSYALPVAIERRCGGSELIEVSSCRKRTLPVAEGRESRVFPTMRELSPENFEDNPALSTFTPATGLEFLVPQPLHIKHSIIGHYAKVHRREDIIDYTSLAIQLGVLDADSASDFLSSKYFIPAGIELGIYPKAWLVETLSKVGLVGMHFVNRYRDRLEGYNRFQIRAVGFLGERLGSYFLIKHLGETYPKNIPAGIFGHMTVVAETNSKYTAGLADQPKQRSRRHNSERIRTE